jgi:type 1 glutamine amidotransferase
MKTGPGTRKVESRQPLRRKPAERARSSSAHWLVLALVMGFTCLGADTNPGSKLKVLVVTGGHGFEKEPFDRMFNDNPGINPTMAAHAGTNATVFERDDLLTYDVVVLYDIRKSITESQKAKFLALFDKGIGLVVLHHAIVSYQHWPEYEKIIGGLYPEPDDKSGVVTAQVGYEHDIEIPVTIVARDHPVTSGLKDFTIHDEIYWGYRVAAGVTPLISTTHPKSGKPLGWCREQGKSRVVYLQLGHGPEAFENRNYRTLVANSIRWTAHRQAAGL